jgi:hypothetical protein
LRRNASQTGFEELAKKGGQQGPPKLGIATVKEEERLSTRSQSVNHCVTLAACQREETGKA